MTNLGVAVTDLLNRRSLPDTSLWAIYPGIERSLGIYKQQFGEECGDWFLEESVRLKSFKHAGMHELIFCCGSPSCKAIGASNRITKHLFQLMQDDG